MTSWLKLVGSSKTPLVDGYTEEYVGFRREGKPGVRPGDRLFFYAPGRNNRRIFALVEALGTPEYDPKFNRDEEGSCQWRLRVRYLINLPVRSGILIDDVITSQRDLTKSVRQAGHIRLLPEESELAYRKLEERAKQ